MNEDVIRREVQQILTGKGFVYLHIPRNTFVEGGIPDICGLGGQAGIAVETKLFEPRVKGPDSFPCREIRDNQRAWLDWLMDACKVPTYLGIGTIKKPRRLWLIPWASWITLEMMGCVKVFGAALRITTEDIDKLYPSTELIWQPGKTGEYKGRFSLPADHPLQAIPSQLIEWKLGEKKISFRFEEVPSAADAVPADERAAV